MRSPDDKSASVPGQVQGKPSRSMGDLWEADTLEADRELVKRILRGEFKRDGRQPGRAPGPGEGAQVSAPAEVLKPMPKHPLPNNMGCSKNGSEVSEVTEAEAGVVKPTQMNSVGIDKLKGSVSVAWGSHFEFKVLPMLLDAKESAKIGDDPLSWIEVALNPARVGATSVGEKKTFREFRVLIPDLDVVLLFNRNQPEDGRKWNFFFEIGAIGCQMRSLEDNTALVYNLVQALGGQVLENAVGLVDIRNDTDAFTPDQFKQWRMEEDRVICRSREFDLKGRDNEAQTVYVGSPKNMVYARIYDKLAELKKKPNATKLFFVQQQMPNALRVTRVEFSCKRKFLRSAGITTLQDLAGKLSSVALYLVTDWLRVVDFKNKRDTKSSPVSGCWKSIQDAMSQAGRISATPITRKNKPEANDKHLESMFFGIAKKLGRRATTTEEFLDEMMERLLRCVKDVGPEQFELDLATLRISEPKHERLFSRGDIRRTPEAILEALNRRNLGRSRADAIRERFERTQTDDAKERRAKWQESQLEFYDQQGKPQMFSLPQGWSDHESEDTSFKPTEWESCSSGPEEILF